MKRRSFLAMLGLAPVAAIVQPEIAAGSDAVAGGGPVAKGLIRWRRVDGPARVGFIEIRPSTSHFLIRADQFHVQG